MKTLKEFNHYFSKKAIREDNKLYFKTLISILVIIFFSLLYVANVDYTTYMPSYNKVIKKRYVNLISKLLIEKKDIKSKSIPGDLNRDNKLSPEEIEALDKKQIQEVNRKRANFQAMQNSIYADLPEESGEDINSDQQLIMELTREDKMRGGANKRGISKQQKTDKMRKYESIYDLIAHPFEYNLSRRGVMYVDIPNDLLRDSEKEHVGYRNPDEINRVVSAHLPMIEHCFQKARRINVNIKGYVKFEFRISYEGFVIPESIRIINSTVRDPMVEACIKKNIKRWRDFPKLDKKMGIARVVQKFAFN